jgi:hypothetical protein
LVLDGLESVFCFFRSAFLWQSYHGFWQVIEAGLNETQTFKLKREPMELKNSKWGQTYFVFWARFVKRTRIDSLWIDFQIRHTNNTSRNLYFGAQSKHLIQSPFAIHTDAALVHLELQQLAPMILVLHQFTIFNRLCSCRSIVEEFSTEGNQFFELLLNQH